MRGDLTHPTRAKRYTGVEAKVPTEGKPIRGASQRPPGKGSSWANRWKGWNEPDPAVHAEPGAPRAQDGGRYPEARMEERDDVVVEDPSGLGQI